MIGTTPAWAFSFPKPARRLSPMEAAAVSTARQPDPIPLRLAAVPSAEPQEPSTVRATAASPAPAEPAEALPLIARLELDAAGLVEAVRGAVRRELADLEARLVELRDLVAAGRSVESAAPTKGTPATAPEEPADVMLTTAELADRQKTSVDTIWRRVSAGKLPPPLRPSPRCPRWPLMMILEWENLGCPSMDEFLPRWRQMQQKGKR